MYIKYNPYIKLWCVYNNRDRIIASYIDKSMAERHLNQDI
jgi:hypothetical protein